MCVCGSNTFFSVLLSSLLSIPERQFVQKMDINSFDVLIDPDLLHIFVAEELKQKDRNLKRMDERERMKSGRREMGGEERKKGVRKKLENRERY